MAVVRNPLESFVWGKGGAALTPEEIAQQREVEQALLAKNGIDTSPVGHWTQGIARVLGAAGGAYRRNKLDAAGVESNDYNSSIINSLLGGSASAPTVPASAAAGEISATSPAPPIDMNGNEVYSQFIDTVKQGGVQNPYALAAIAATGKAESGFEPGNVNRTWSDPSQSGQPGTAGGIMSWRGPRYDALAATGDLSPAGQAKFFLQEDPNLIAALNKAGSVEEAQSLMNRAWAFAGYDQPGGEAARRLQTAQSLLPSFQASGEVAATSPQAAIEAIAPTQGASLSDEVSAFRQTPEYAAQFPGRQMETASSPQQSPVVQQMAQAAPAQTGINPAILRALSDPRATPQTRAVAQALMQQDAAAQQAAQEQQTWMQRQQYEQAQQANDPLRRQQLDMGAIELERARNPQPGFRTLTAAEKQANGLPANGAFQVGVDGKIMQIGGGGININNEGSIPAGYMAVRDGEGRVTAIQPIPGSPQAMEAEQAKRSQETRSAGKETAGNTITLAAQRAREAMSADGLPATGVLGKIAAISPASNAAEVRRQIDVLKSNATVETLGAMRAASPTGGALGSVTEKEGAMLAAKAGTLDPDSPNFARDLDDYERTLLETIHGPEVGRAIFNQTRKKGPAVIDGYQIEEAE